MYLIVWSSAWHIIGAQYVVVERVNQQGIGLRHSVGQQCCEENYRLAQA